MKRPRRLHPAAAALLLCAALLLTGCAAPSSSAPAPASAGSEAPSGPAMSAAVSGPGTDPAPSVPAASSALAASSAAVPHSDGTEGRAALTSVPGLGNENALEPPAFLTGDQQMLYMAAYRLYYRFDVSSGFAPNYAAQPLTTADGLAFYPDDAFATWDKFDRALRLAFTDRFADELLADKAQAYRRGEDGRLYVSPADRGGDLTYRSSSFELTAQTDTEIDFDVVGVYNEHNFDDSAASVPDTTRHLPLKLVLTADGWRFDSFALPY